MIATAVADEIQRLLEEGELSQRKIARQMGVSRGTVNAIALGKRALKAARPGDDFQPPTGPAARCPTCGGMVQMPCLACRLRRDRARQRTQPGAPRHVYRTDRRPGRVRCQPAA